MRNGLKEDRPWTEFLEFEEVQIRLRDVRRRSGSEDGVTMRYLLICGFFALGLCAAISASVSDWRSAAFFACMAWVVEAGIRAYDRT